MDSRRREKELLAKKRRMLVKSGSSSGKSDNPQPMFQPVQRRGSQDEMHKRAKNVLGDYHTVVESMNAFRDPSKLLGIIDNTPSTPVLPPKHNPFDPKFRSALPTTTSSSSTPSTSSTASAVTTKGGHLSRHQVAEPPRPTSGLKKEKGVKHPKNAKLASSSKGVSGGSGGSSKKTSSMPQAGSGEGNGDSSRPTNILVVPKHKKRGMVRPAKPVPPSPTAGITSGGGSGIGAGQTKQQKQGAFGDLFKVDLPVNSDRTSGGIVGTKSSSKSRKTHGHLQQHQAPPTSSSEPHPPNHSSSSTIKSSNGLNSSSLMTHGDASSAQAIPSSSSSHKLKKSSSATLLSIGSNFSISSVDKDASSSTDTKVVLRLQKTGSMDHPVSPQRQALPPHMDDERTNSIDIAQLRAMKFNPFIAESSNASAISLPSGLSMGKKDKRKKPKKTKKKVREGERERTKEMEDIHMDLSGVKPLVNTMVLPVATASGPPVSTAAATIAVEPTSSHMSPVLGHVTTAGGHVTTVGGHVTKRTQGHRIAGTSRISQVSYLSKQRPSNLQFDNSAAIFPSEESMDSGDIQSMLKEMMPSVNSIVTPISTPKKSIPFDFSPPTVLPPSNVTKSLYRMQEPKPLPVSSLTSTISSSSLTEASSKGHPPSHLLNATSSDEESDSESKQGVAVAMSTLDQSLATERPIDVSTSSESSSGSSDSSGSSSSDSSESSDEGSQSFCLEKFHPTLPSAITPIRGTPPHINLAAISKLPMISPLAEEELANLVPPMSNLGHGQISHDNSAYSQSTSVYSQAHPQQMHDSLSLSNASQGFAAISQTPFPLAGTTTSTVPIAATSGGTGLPDLPVTLPVSVENDLDMSDSSSSGSEDSGNESDTESSDTDDDQSGDEKDGEEEEEEEEEKMVTSVHQDRTLLGGNSSSPHSEEQLTVSFSSTGFPFGQDGNSTGFMEGMEIFGGGSGIRDLSRNGREEGKPQAHHSQLQQEPATSDSLSREVSIGFDTETQPFSTHPIFQSASLSEFDTVPRCPSLASSSSSTKSKRSGRKRQDAPQSKPSAFQEQQLREQEQKDASIGRKRKQKAEPESAPVTDLVDIPAADLVDTPAPKAPKLASKSFQQPMAPQQATARWLVQQAPPPPSSNRGATLSSSISISESESSGSSSSSEEEDEEEEGEGEAIKERLAFKEVPSTASADQLDVAMQDAPPPPTPVTPVARVATLQGNEQQAAAFVKSEVNQRTQQEVTLKQQDEGDDSGGSSLVVVIPLGQLVHQKPKAKVEPILQNPTPNSSKRRRATSDISEHEEPHVSRRISTERDGYTRHRDEEYNRDYHRDGERGRPHSRDGRWEPPRDRRHSSSDDLPRPPRGVSRRDRGTDYRERERGGSWERDYHRDREWGGYYERDREYIEGRRPRPGSYHDRVHSSEHYLKEARGRKHDADKIRTPGVEKARAYMESVTYFMRHGDMIEREIQQHKWDAMPTKNPCNMYMDTIRMIRHCEKMAGDCKPIVVMCLRCLSVLYWRLFVLKQNSMAQIQKELQEFFIPPKSLLKSPYANSFSPLPSPASVGSTGSTGSSSGAMSSSMCTSQDPSLSPSNTVTVPRRVFNRATEHLSITSHINLSFESWRQSEMLVEQCREFFSQVDRKFGGRITQYSPIPHMAEWAEVGLRALRYV